MSRKGANGQKGDRSTLWKLRRRAKTLADYSLRRPALGTGPPMYEVETTTRCNLHCSMCTRQRGLPEPRDMEPALFERLIEESRDFLEGVNLFGLGEPLLDPHIYDRVALCREAGVHTHVSTNGTLLTEEAADRLLDAGLDWLTIAVDGTTAEAYEQYRVGAAFSEVVANAHRFLEAKLRRKSEVFVVLQMVILPGNRHQVADFKRYWAPQRGVDAVRFKFDEFGLDEMAVLPEVERRRAPCFYLWNGPLLVRADGSLHLCCPVAMFEAPTGKFPDVSISAFYNSPKALALRRAHLEGDLSEHPLCASCSSPKPRFPLANLASGIEPFTIRKLDCYLEHYLTAHHLVLYDRQPGS